jgi:cell division protease FtsH
MTRKTFFLSCAIVISLYFLFNLIIIYSHYNLDGKIIFQTIPVNFSDFIDAISNHSLKRIWIDQNVILFQSGTSLDIKQTQGYLTDTILDTLYKEHININYINHSHLWGLLTPILFMLILLVGPYLFKKLTMNGIKNFNKEKNSLTDPSKNKIRFDDVAGADEAKEELMDIVDFLKNPEKYSKMGGKIPKGVILSGPPGTGKTLLAKAIAGEAGVPFFSMSGSDFVEMFVGVGAARVRSLFEEARKKAPCIIFIDEIDAFGKSRVNNTHSGNDEREGTLNQFLVEMDGFKNSNDNIIVIGATNRVDILDPAMLRPGRFDRKVVLGNPDIKGREQILSVHCRNAPLDSTVDIKKIARITPGFSGAELANLVNEAIIIASKAGKNTVGMNDFEKSRDKCILGSEKKSMILTENDKKVTAYHEAGHTLCGLIETAGDPLHKVTIIPRSNALGITYSMPLDNKLSYTYEYILAKLIMIMGGRAAEEIVFGKNKISNGATGDIKQATELAKAMVTEWGMSKNIGMVAYQLDGFRATSESTMKEVENEIKQIIENAYIKAKEILTTHNVLFEALTKKLIEVETLSAEEIIKIPEFQESGIKFNVNIEQEIDQKTVNEIVEG